MQVIGSAKMPASGQAEETTETKEQLMRKFIRDVGPCPYTDPPAIISFHDMSFLDKEVYKVDIYKSLEGLSEEKLTLLYECLEPFFTRGCSSEDRLRIINCFRSISQDQWQKLSKEMLFLLPQEICTSQNMYLSLAAELAPLNPQLRSEVVKAVNIIKNCEMSDIQIYQAVKNILKLTPDNIRNFSKKFFAFEPEMQTSFIFSLTNGPANHDFLNNLLN